MEAGDKKKDLSYPYGVVAGAGYDTDKMAPKEVVEKFKELSASATKEKLQKELPKKPIEKITASKKMLRNFIQRVQNGQAEAKEICELGTITDRTKADIERLTGQKLNATEHVISATEIIHILNRHGEEGKADRSMSTVEDFEDIVDVLQNYDSISLSAEKSKFKNAQGERAQIIEYSERLDSHTQIVAEAVSDGKKGKLRVISAYKTSS